MRYSHGRHTSKEKVGKHSTKLFSFSMKHNSRIGTARDFGTRSSNPYMNMTVAP